ncbi:carbohydrate ABC transporter permease [Kineococcus sp. DHX-1]|uniref:carbohydrate ABC transporter permease n=1 Tax=Kineococcus sp. DHX-1 TaxID=3349638 RepID=UPI0036D39D74
MAVTLPRPTSGSTRGDLRARPVRTRRARWTARLVLVVISLAFLAPLYWMVASALKSDTELSAFPPTLWPHELHWENFSAAVQSMPFFTFFRNTVVVTVLSVVFAVASNFVVAYGFSCLQWPGRDKVFYVVIATLFIPFPITLIPMFDLYAKLGWINTWAPLVVPSMFASAFYVFLIRQFLLQFPRDVLDAASIDGANAWRTLWTVVFPQARPALATVAIFAAVGSWNDFMGPLLYLQDQDVQTLSIGIQAYTMTASTEDFQYNQLMAVSFLVILPLVVLFFLFQRYFIRGATVGSFK